MLRARPKTGSLSEWHTPDSNELRLDEDTDKPDRRRTNSWRVYLRRKRITRTRLICLLAAFLLIFGGYMRLKYSIRSGGFMRLAEPEPATGSQATLNASESRAYSNLIKKNDTHPKDHLQPVSKRSWKYPLVDRAILKKLERKREFFVQNGGLLPLASIQAAVSRFQWPPIVTGIPKRRPRPAKLHNDGGGSSSSPKPATVAICESDSHPRPCRFLLPLRVAEQESKARIHLSQLVLLARHLDRTLVLPNVGKSKIGACFAWPIETYYDIASLSGDMDSQEIFVDLEAFRSWLDRHDRPKGGLIESQLVSVAPMAPLPDGLRKETFYGNEHVEVHAYETSGNWEKDVPGCLGNKFHNLGFESRPVFVSTRTAKNKDGSNKPIADFILDAFAAISPRIPRVEINPHPLNTANDHAISPEPQVLVVNWDLRHPVFPSPPNGQALQYSTQMHDLAHKHAPKSPYLVIQWRMETVNPESLHDCAHALVDVLARVLYDHALAASITTVWFASDYPYPIARRSASQPRPAMVAKSGTFRDFEIRHEEAVEVLRKAFDQQGELEAWKLTDLSDSLKADDAAEKELLDDPGVLGILDKLVSINADFFISGSSQCARKSSFTKQIDDARRIEWSRSRDSHLRNVIDIFG